MKLADQTGSCQVGRRSLCWSAGDIFKPKHQYSPVVTKNQYQQATNMDTYQIVFGCFHGLQSHNCQ